MSSYASLQLLLDEQVEAARERIIYIITAHMDSLGMMPCGRGSAERTVSFVHIAGGWVVYDDCAERMDIRALDGLGRCLTCKFRTHAIGVMGSEQQRLLRLYNDGCLMDTYSTSPEAFGGRLGSSKCRGHALRWRSLLKKGTAVHELSAAFLLGRENTEQGFHDVEDILGLDRCTSFGFASTDDADMPPVITLYFCAANHVRQRLFDRLFKPARCTGTIAGVLFRRPR